MKRLIVVLLLSMSIFALAQDKPTEKPAEPVKAPTIQPLTSDEKIALLSSQVNIMQANAALEATPQKKALDAANEGIRQTVDAIYAKRKITNNDAVLCKGPGSGPGCDKSPVGEFSLQPAVKAEVKK